MHPVGQRVWGLLSMSWEVPEGVPVGDMPQSGRDAPAEVGREEGDGGRRVCAYFLVTS